MSVNFFIYCNWVTIYCTNFDVSIIKSLRDGLNIFLFVEKTTLSCISWLELSRCSLICIHADLSCDKNEILAFISNVFTQEYPCHHGLGMNQLICIFWCWHLGSLYWHGLTLIPAWLSNHTPNKVWDEIVYPFPNFNGATIEVWEWIRNSTPHFIMGVITSPCWI